MWIGAGHYAWYDLDCWVLGRVRPSASRWLHLEVGLPTEHWAATGRSWVCAVHGFVELDKPQLQQAFALAAFTCCECPMLGVRKESCTAGCGPEGRFHYACGHRLFHRRRDACLKLLLPLPCLPAESDRVPAQSRGSADAGADPEGHRAVSAAPACLLNVFITFAQPHTSTTIYACFLLEYHDLTHLTTLHWLWEGLPVRPADKLPSSRRRPLHQMARSVTTGRTAHRHTAQTLEGILHRHKAIRTQRGFTPSP